MAKRRNVKKEVVGTIHYLDLVINSANKLGRHMDIVKTGTGVQVSKKNYNRKNEKTATRKIIKDYTGGCCLFFQRL